MGTGGRPGAIDLPLIRRRHTRVPYVPGSSVKGALRTHVEAELEKPDDLVDEILRDLGEDTEERRERALRVLFGDRDTKGAVTFGDLLPVAVPAPVALEGGKTTPLVWLTCPYVLDWIGVEAPEPDGEALAPSGFPAERVVLEHRELVVRRNGKVDGVADELVVPGPWKLPLHSRLLILDDATFAGLLDPDRPVVTELRTRVRLGGPWDKTVEEGALWTEEFLPQAHPPRGTVRGRRVHAGSDRGARARGPPEGDLGTARRGRFRRLRRPTVELRGGAGMSERSPENVLLSRLREDVDEELKGDLSTLCSVLLYYGLPGALVLAEREDVREALSRLPLDRIERELEREGLPRADRLATRLADLARNAAAVGELPEDEGRDRVERLRRRVAEAAEESLVPEEGVRTHPYHEKRTLALRALSDGEENLRREVRRLLRRVVDAAEKAARSDEIRGYVGSYLKTLRELGRSPHLRVREVELRFPHSRLVVGMGGPHPAENDLTLDPVTGLPVIPGTTLKGVARAAGELILERGDPDELRKYFGADDTRQARKRFREVFGSKPRESEPKESDDGNASESKRAGEVTFHDALPDPDWLRDVDSPLEVDVLNPHYGEYYEGEGPPHESMRPKPVEFLTVRRGSRWRTVLVSERRGSLDVALRLLKYGVERLGIGARTCAGYGYGEVRY
nr:type III-B CRISPR module RAMP protein Cmr6 [Methanopyrus kandleri]